MTRLKTLIPLDGSSFSRHVLPSVEHMLRPAEHELVLLRVDDEPVGVSGAPSRYLGLNGYSLPEYASAQEAALAQHPIYATQIRQTTQDTLHDELEREAQQLRAAGYHVVTAVRFGAPAEEILACIEEAHIDLVAMATHGRTGVQRLVLGSVAAAVLQQASVPVLLVRPSDS